MKRYSNELSTPHLTQKVVSKQNLDTRRRCTLHLVQRDHNATRIRKLLLERQQTLEMTPNNFWCRFDLDGKLSVPYHNWQLLNFVNDYNTAIWFSKKSLSQKTAAALRIFKQKYNYWGLRQ